MIPYIVFCAIILFSGIFVESSGKTESNPKLKKKYAIFLCALFIVFNSLRTASVGADTSVYISAIPIYRNYSLWYLLNHFVYPFDFEKGYVIVTKLFADTNLRYQFFFVVLSFLMYPPIFRAIYKYSKCMWLSTISYVCILQFTYTLGIFRQAIAVAICICALEYVFKSKPFPFILLVLLAFFFHKSALIFLIVYPAVKFFLNLKDKTTFFFLVFAVEIVFLLFGSPILKFAFKLFPDYASYVGTKYGISVGGYLFLIFLTFFFLICWYLLQQGKIEEKEMLYFIALLGLAIVFQSIAYSMAIIGRTIWYFSISLMILIPNLFEKMFKKQNVKLVYAAFAVFCLAYFFYTLPNTATLVPYTFFH